MSGERHQQDNVVPAFMSCPSFYLFINPFFIQDNRLQTIQLAFSFSLPHTHSLYQTQMHPVLSTMRIPGLRRPVFLVLVASAVAALSLLFWSRQYVEITSSGGGQRVHVSGSKGKACLTREFTSSFSPTVYGEYHHSINPSIPLNLSTNSHVMFFTLLGESMSHK